MKAELQERTEEHSVVAEVASAMLSPLALAQVLTIAVETVSRALGAKFGSIALLSPDKRTLEIVAVYHLPPDYPEKVRRTAPLRADQSSASGRALESRRPYVVSDVQTDPLFAPWRQLAEEEGYRSLISVPLLVGDGVIGTLNQYLAEPRHFISREIRLLTVVAQQVCLAIERAHLYEQLKQQHDLAQTANERKSQFLVAMSHALRSPMTAILGFTDLLLQQLAGPLTDEQQRQLCIISYSAQHLMVLINDALDLARIEAGKMDFTSETLDLASLAVEVVEMLAPLAETKGITLQCLQEEKPVIVRADAQKCKQILVNLVSNAIKFTTRGGVQVHARRDPSDPRVARISVADTGSGIKTDNLPLLFHEFQQLQGSDAETPRGSGLGLSLSRKLAQMMNGDIEVASRYGQGSTFTLKLEAGE